MTETTTIKTEALGIAAVLIVAAAAAGVVVWLATPETPPPCAGNLSREKAKTLLMAELIEDGYAAVDAQAFEIASIRRRDEDNWPTFYVSAKGQKAGLAQSLLAAGNGCGFFEITNMGRGG